jgi:transcriptional regulator with XRE-family HTH domain
MKITSELADQSLLEELGTRLARRRIDAGLTQAALAEEAGVAKRTVERVESGHGAELLTVIRLLRILRLIEGFEALVPEQPPSPLALLKRRGRARRRVSHARTPGATARQRPPRKPWTWAE